MIGVGLLLVFAIGRDERRLSGHIAYHRQASCPHYRQPRRYHSLRHRRLASRRAMLQNSALMTPRVRWRELGRLFEARRAAPPRGLYAQRYCRDISPISEITPVRRQRTSRLLGRRPQKNVVGQSTRVEFFAGHEANVSRVTPIDACSTFATGRRRLIRSAAMLTRRYCFCTPIASPASTGGRPRTMRHAATTVE